MISTNSVINRPLGYARVSTDDQNLSLQIDALIRFGVQPNDIYSDKISGAKADRPGLEKCMSSLRPGDTLVVWRLDRLGRSMRHLVTLVEDLRENNIGFKSISDGAIDTTTASGELESRLAKFKSGMQVYFVLPRVSRSIQSLWIDIMRKHKYEKPNH